MSIYIYDSPCTRSLFRPEMKLLLQIAYTTVLTKWAMKVKLPASSKLHVPISVQFGSPSVVAGDGWWSWNGILEIRRPWAFTHFVSHQPPVNRDYDSPCTRSLFRPEMKLLLQIAYTTVLTKWAMKVKLPASSKLHVPISVQFGSPIPARHWPPVCPPKQPLRMGMAAPARSWRHCRGPLLPGGHVVVMYVNKCHEVNCTAYSKEKGHNGCTK